jgi:hypothetical protein
VELRVMSEPKTQTQTLTVTYECIDGVHIFESTDRLVRGIYAASTSLQEAFDDVPVQAETLLKLNHGIEAEVDHECTYEEFLEQILPAASRGS